MVACLLTACSEPDTGNRVLAKVNGEPVYQVHVDAMLSRFPSEAVARSGGEIQKTVLESLVRGRAVAALAREALDEDQLREITLRSELYQEELLAAAYIESQAQLEPVTDAMVKEYYTRHREKYSLGRRLHLQYFESAVKLEDTRKRQLMQRLSSIDATSDWKTIQKELRAEGFDVVFHETQVQESLLTAPLSNIVARMKAGEASAVIYGEPLYRARIVSVEDLGSRPLAEVDAEIRTMLAPVQMKKAIQRVADEAMKKASIQYYDQQ
jgi:hypothetical protein